MKSNIAKDVDEYIANSPVEAQPTLKELRALIISTLPKAEESISWNVPFYKYLGEIGGFDACKNHVSFGIGAEVLGDKERNTLEAKGYKTGKATMQIRFDQKIPTSEIKQLLKAKAKLNEEKKAKN